MISCLLIHVSRNPQGLPVCKDSVIAGVAIQIGRGAACKVHLLDHRVSLLHASVRRSEDGALYIDGERNATLKINGFIAQSAPLLPGTHIEIGPYVLVVEPAASGHDLILSVELIHPLNEQDAAMACRTTPVTIAALGLNKRKLGFSLAACILFLYLLLPMLPSASVAFDKWQAGMPFTLNGSWSPGPLAGGHALFEAKCSTCHQGSFQAISDEVCTGCHKQVGKHLKKEDLQLKTFKTTRCTDCHSDHKGSERLVLHDSSTCVSCHGDIKQKVANSELANVKDFSTGHPPFHVTLQNGQDVIRVRQGDKLIEKPGLKYSHKVHLAKEGVSTPQGDTVMRCQDCHKLEESGRHFAPMTMKKTCQQSDCHALELTEPAEGLAPHGSELAVMNHLRVFYGKWLNDSPENRAACDPAVQGITACADDLARKNAAATLFSKNKECGECHEIEPARNNDAPWKVAPVQINRDWQPGAAFAHAKHEAMGCADCHDKMNSRNSADISMPAIAKCRECHVGNHPARGKISSGCDSCHRFHQREK